MEAWRAGAPVGAAGALARALVMANLAQPLPPPAAFPVTVVIPVRDRPITRLIEALDVDEVILFDDASTHPVPEATIRFDTRRGAAAARNAGLAAARNDLVALLDSDTLPEPGWLL